MYQISVAAGIAAISVCVLSAQALVLSGARPQASGGRMGCIDGLRGFLAFGVFLHHYVITYSYRLTGLWTDPRSSFYKLAGGAGIAFFFMITGFLFWHKILSAGGKVDWTKLYASRVFRIVPLYWFVVALVVFLVFSVGGLELNVSAMRLASQMMAWLSFARLLPPDINGFRGTNIIVAGSLWTLKYEWVFYLCLPLMAVLITESRRLPVLMWLAAGCVIAVRAYNFKIPYLELDTNMFIYFVTGAFSAFLYRYEALRNMAQKSVLSWVAVISLGLLFTFFNSIYGVAPLLLMAAFFIIVALGNSIFGVLRLPAVVLMGEISYSMYLLHGVLLYICFSVLLPDFMRAASPALVSATMALMGALLVGISWVSYCLIEKPGMRLGKHVSGWLGRKPAAAEPAGAA